MEHLTFVTAVVAVLGLSGADQDAPKRSAPIVNGLSVHLATDKRTYEPGEPVKLEVTFRNHTDRAIRIWQSGYPHYGPGYPRLLGRPRYRAIPDQVIRLVVDGEGRGVVPVPGLSLPPKGRRSIWLTLATEPEAAPGAAGMAWPLKTGRHAAHLELCYFGLYRSWNGKARSNRVVFELAASRLLTAVPAPAAQPAFDLDAAQKLLTKRVGGTWRKSRRPHPFVGHTLEVDFKANGAHATWASFRVVGFPPGSDQVARVLSPMHSNAPGEVVWGNDACTVIRYGDLAPQEEAKIVETLSLGRPRRTLERLEGRPNGEPPASSPRPPGKADAPRQQEAPMDIDAVRDLLERSLGGSWKIATSANEDRLQMLTGALAEPDLCVAARWPVMRQAEFEVFPYPFSGTARERIFGHWRLSRRPLYMVGSNDQLTVLVVNVKGPASKKMVAALGLSRPKVTFAALSVAHAARMAKLKTFSLTILVQGAGWTRSVQLSVRPVPEPVDLAAAKAAISTEQASRILDHLLNSGLISPIRDRPKQPPRCLAVLGWGLANRWYSDLGRGPLSLDRLSGLREVVTGEAARDMDRLLAELEQKAY